MSRKLLLTVLSLALAALAFAAPAAFAQSDPPGVNPTHYWTYQPTQGAHFQPEFIQARDQFFLGFTPIYLDSLQRLVNWVHKNNSPVLDTMIHYTWWNIQNKLPNQSSAILTNQFGQYPINIERLEFMLVPAWKNVPQPGSPDANHYLCYRAFGGPPPPGAYQLRDEWRQDLLPVSPLEYLCAPCWKEHGGVVYPAVDTVTHLAMYRIHPVSERFLPYIQDQFFNGICDVQQRPVEYLMVPSLKQLIPTPTKARTWGRLKTLYR